MSESQLKFASFDEAISHLSEVTGKRIKIAWTDQSKEILRTITEEVKKKPSLMTRFKKYTKEALEPGMTVKPSSKGNLYIVNEIDKDMMGKMFDSIEKAPKSEIFSIVQKDKESFPEFHEKYKKGLQEQDGNYRGKPSLIQRGKDWLSGEKGEKSKEQKEEEKEIKEHFNSNRDIAKNKAKKLSDANARDSFISFFSHPDNEKIRNQFVEEFSDGLKDGEIPVEEAKEYEKILLTYMKRMKKDLSGELPKFIEVVKKFSDKVEEKVDEAEKKEEKKEEVEKKEKKKKDVPESVSYFDDEENVGMPDHMVHGGDEEQIIDGLINVWTEVNFPKGV